MNNQDLLNQLWEKYLADQKMTAGELKQLRALVQNTQHQQQLDQLLATLYNETQQIPPTAETNAREAFEEVWARLQPATPAQETTVLPIPRRNYWYKYAAAVLILCAAAGGVYQLTRSKTHNNTTQPTAQTPTGIQPGTDKALLKLADGSYISLSEAENGTLAQQGNTQVVKLANGQLAYQNAGATDSKVLYNTIITPRGGRFSLTLPDGSKVWLNAEGSLYYPTAFTGSTREVTLTGEAYFEIAPDAAHPFQVRVNNMLVNVLGTQFNIMAYTDEPAIQTTLLQGSVQVSSTGGSTHRLTPGQRASLPTGSNRMQIQNEVDTEETIAWKNDQLLFAGSDVPTAMRMIARWYNVEVEYRGAVPNAHFRGSISGKAPITEVLNMMQQTGEVHFTISGRKIIVTP
ncbi:ferric-dicitrate binding protein FerR (iron transport regulator) [Filimonas zeae]|uniref:Anti-sigma factor n=1 Tax=Filimonas zeae TaxID=1737353 RepID=A0A917IWP5_9BACT|nr:FecR family protein [Filimonas zeae]MDR6338736.1 ferric-dicitrate binding protein FerR (iron transport regulator) [Filimonas zeae]GGH66828.1 anti-sigma factor [Filimonas zeae]